MKRVCFFINDISNSGGTEKITLLTANFLAKTGFDVTILTIEPYSRNFFDIDEQVKVKSLNILKCGNIIRRFKIANALKRTFRTKKFDYFIVVDTLLMFYILPIIWRKNCTFICWEHFNFNIDLGVKLRVYSRYLASIFSDEIILLTKKDKLRWSKRLPWCKNKIHVFYNPSSYTVSNENYNVNNKVVLAIGRLTYQKGFDLLIKAWSYIAKDHSDWKLKIVGSGECCSLLQQQARDLDIDKQVQLVPATVSIENHYLSAGIFCMPSRFEGIGLVLIEAQAFGLPSVAFDCDCGPSEVIDHQNGYLVQEGDVLSLSKSISALINDDRLRIEMSVNARANAEKYSKERYLNRWLVILSEK